MVFYNLSIIGDNGSLYHLEDSHIASLKRENDELFIKETIPSLHIQQVIKYYKCDILFINYLNYIESNSLC